MKATIKKLLRNTAGCTSNANWKKLGLQERFLIIIEHHPLNASQSLNILSLVSQLPDLGCYC